MERIGVNRMYLLTTVAAADPEARPLPKRLAHNSAFGVGWLRGLVVAPVRCIRACKLVAMPVGLVGSGRTWEGRWGQQP